jgi:hypothetical protein
MDIRLNRFLGALALSSLALLVNPPASLADCADNSVSDGMDRAKDAAKEISTDPGNAVDHARRGGRGRGKLYSVRLGGTQ